MNSQVVLNAIVSCGVYAVAAVSFKIIYSTWRVFHFSHAAVYPLSAYGAWICSHRFELPLWASIPLGALAAVIFVSLVTLPVYRTLDTTSSPSWRYLVASIGCYTISVNLLAINFGTGSHTIRTWKIRPGHEILGGRITDHQLALLSFAVISLISLSAFLKATQAGLLMRALALDPDLSEVWGLPSRKLRYLAFMAGSGLAAILGGLIVASVDFDPYIGFNTFLYSFVALVIGGRGLVRGPVIGAAALAVSQHTAAFWFGAEWMNAVAYGGLAAWFCFASASHALRA